MSLIHMYINICSFVLKYISLSPKKKQEVSCSFELVAFYICGKLISYTNCRKILKLSLFVVISDI